MSSKGTGVEQACIFCGQTKDVDECDHRPWSCNDCHPQWEVLPLRIRNLINYLLSKAGMTPEEAVAGVIGEERR